MQKYRKNLFEPAKKNVNLVKVPEMQAKVLRI
jgi:hypothetical protein